MIKLKYTLKNGKKKVENTRWKSFKEIIEWCKENNFTCYELECAEDNELTFIVHNGTYIYNYWEEENE